MTRRTIAWSFLCLAMAASPLAAEPAPRVYRFEQGAPPFELTVRVSYAMIEIDGTDREDVALWVESLKPEGEDLASVLTLLVPEIEGRSMRIERPENQDWIHVRLEVPRSLRLNVWGSNGGRVTIRKVDGPMSIENSNDGVTLEDVSGTAVVFTSNGSIEASFVRVTPVPMSFVTSNGAIDLTVPADLSANVLLETDNAGFSSDFTIEPGTPFRDLPLPPKRRRATGSINGGGFLLRLQTENADIKLRSRDRHGDN